MTNKLTFYLSPCVISLLALFTLSACGADESDSGDISSTSTLSFAVSDAPVDDLEKVVICFSQIELKSSMGDVMIDMAPNVENENENENENEDVACTGDNIFAIDLLAFPGSQAFTLLEGITIEAGEYTQLRLIIADGSYAVLVSDNSMSVDVVVPSNELKLDGFSAPIGGAVDLTAEFDLRKSMTNPVGQDHYILKPRGVRLIDSSESVTVSGSVDVDTFCSISTPAVGDVVASVYLYEGINLTGLGDNGGNEANLPYASTSVTDTGEGYKYEVGFVASGSYTLAFACDTEDSPEKDDDITLLQPQELILVTDDKVVDF